MKTASKKLWAKPPVRFAVIGVINTLIDFGILNGLVFVFGLPKIPSNIVSTSAAMTFSFFANQKVVFKSQFDKTHIIKFLAVTLSGLYIIQSLLIYFFTEIWLLPADIAGFFFDGIFSEDFIQINTAKVIATAVTMVWNYVLYKKFVFVDRQPKPKDQPDEA